MKEEPAIVAEFAQYFAACDEVCDFARQHRPAHARDTAAGHAVLWTVARSYRTYLAVVHLCRCGYAQQAAMLNRTLFEDMVSAHWAIKHPEIAAERLVEHDRYTALLRAEPEQFDKHGLKHRETKLPKYSEEERARLDRRYRNGSASWTGKTLPAMVRALQSMWQPADRRLLNQLHDVGHRANNTLLHHSAASLSQGVRINADGVTFDVGPSKQFVPGALAFALWTFPNTFSLVVEGDTLAELNALMQKYGDLYSKTRDPEE